MLVILPMHHRSPSAAGTVPTSMGGVLAELAEPAMLGAVIAHPSDGHDAQLHVHCAPEAVSKLTASTAPAAAMDACTALPTARKPASVRTADSRRGGGRRASRRGRRRYGRRRRSCTSAAGVKGVAKLVRQYRAGRAHCPAAMWRLTARALFAEAAVQRCPEEHM